VAPAHTSETAAAVGHGADGHVPRLRPIFYGVSRVGPGAPPELVASVHSVDEELLGYVAIDRLRPAPAWGFLLAQKDLSVDDVCVLARETSAQLALYGIARGSCHFLFTAGSGGTDGRARRAEYLAGLSPLREKGLCRFASDGSAAAEDLTRAGLVASATASTRVALRAVGVPHDATVSQHLPSRASRAVATALGREHTSDAADVLIVGAPLWTLGVRQASALRCRLLVSLGPVRLADGVEEILDERKIVVLPEALVAGGRLLGLHLVEQGLDASAALIEVAALAESKTDELFTRFPAGPRVGESRDFVLPASPGAPQLA
jgi:hypothetical protein